MKIFMIIFMIMVVIVELFILVGCSLTVKYQIEMTTDISVLRTVYSMLDTLGMIIIFNLLYLVVMYILYFKKTKRG